MIAATVSPKWKSSSLHEEQHVSAPKSLAPSFTACARSWAREPDASTHYLRSTALRRGRALPCSKPGVGTLPHDSHIRPISQHEAGSRGSEELLDGEEVELVTQIFASWSQLTSWLRQVERLKHAASLESQAPSQVTRKADPSLRP
jgi:hypothetical protein